MLQKLKRQLRTTFGNAHPGYLKRCAWHILAELGNGDWRLKTYEDDKFFVYHERGLDDETFIYLKGRKEPVLYAREGYGHTILKRYNYGSWIDDFLQLYYTAETIKEHKQREAFKVID